MTGAAFRRLAAAISYQVSTDTAAEILADYRAEVLREAAAKIRAEATKMDDPGPSQTIRRAGMRHAADLIDPDKT